MACSANREMIFQKLKTLEIPQIEELLFYLETIHPTLRSYLKLNAPKVEIAIDIIRILEQKNALSDVVYLLEKIGSFEVKNNFTCKSYKKVRQNIFILYNSQDISWFEKLLCVLYPLERDNLVTLWHNKKISTGQNRQEKIKEYFEQSSIVLTLVTPNLLSSSHFYEYDIASKKIAWIYITHCLYETTILSTCKPINTSKVPLDSLSQSQVNNEILSICYNLINM